MLLSLPMNAGLALFALRLGLFLVIYEDWSKRADVKEYSKKIPGGVPLVPTTGEGEFSDRSTL